MASAKLQDIVKQAEVCAFSRRMPAHAERLAAAAAQLDQQSLDQFRSIMLQKGIPERMARRACQAAPSSLVGAKKIIDSMIFILGRHQTILALQAANYFGFLAICIRRFATKKMNRFKAANELYQHLCEIFGDGPSLQELALVVAGGQQSLSFA